MIKTLIKAGIEGIYIKIIKTTDDKSTANIMLKGITQGFQILPFLFNIVLEVLTRAIKQQDDLILYTENPNVSIKKLSGVIDEYIKLEGYKINIQKSVGNNETTNN